MNDNNLVQQLGHKKWCTLIKMTTINDIYTQLVSWLVEFISGNVKVLVCVSVCLCVCSPPLARCQQQINHSNYVRIVLEIVLYFFCIYHSCTYFVQ